MMARTRSNHHEACGAGVTPYYLGFPAFFDYYPFSTSFVAGRRLMARNHFPEGDNPPPRQTDVRLSPAECKELEYALLGNLTPDIREAIEDGVFRYRAERERERQERPEINKRLAEFERRLERAQRLTRELRELLPVVSPAAEAEMLHGQGSAADATDEALLALLERRERAWRLVADAVPQAQNHQSSDDAIYRLGFVVVSTLDAEGIPLTLGRETEVVLVLGIVRKIAAGEMLPKDYQAGSADYEFSRAVVDAYLKSRSPQ